MRAKLGTMSRCGKGEPKTDKVVEVLRDHFKNAKEQGIEDSRAIVFANLRDSATSIQNALNELHDECGVSAQYACCPCCPRLPVIVRSGR